MPNLDLINADVLHPEGLSRAPLSFSEGLIREAPVGRRVDLTGFQVLPGIVDLHGDAFEQPDGAL